MLLAGGCVPPGSFNTPSLLPEGLRGFPRMMWVDTLKDVAHPGALWTLFPLVIICTWECIHFMVNTPQPCLGLCKWLDNKLRPFTQYVTSFDGFDQPWGAQRTD